MKLSSPRIPKALFHLAIPVLPSCPARVSEAIEIERLFEPRQMGPRIRAFEFVLGETGPAGFD